MIMFTRLSLCGVFLFVGLVAAACAGQADLADQQEADSAVRYGSLSSQELAIFAAGQELEQDIIDMLQEHIRLGVEAGKLRGAVLCEIRDVFKRITYQNFSTTEMVALIGGGIAVSLASFFLAKYVGDAPSCESIQQQAEDDTGSDCDDQESDTFSEEELDLQ